MLQRVLAGLTSLEGVEQAMLVDDNGHLMACVGNEGEIPPLDSANQIISIALETCTALGIGQLYEIWCEGKDRMMIDIAGPERIVVLSGKGGRLARWRHALDRDRRIIATTPQM
ncbi:MAG: hypothetical protein CL978_02975 [Euryarchaeota archaeon]|jgi:predicted regulator of Ras-like GTPase activity (Roadblock/LC7/MglB family)|nr:hypothetical protein [Euryarchaeota archaeon]MBR95692.1 hypothetical protein [Euryarchaeota archaeon]|tara:strand:- start:817 stop:1158 length:342 start_codon:yes stop_codon:yes gene_type:complete